MAKHIKYQQSQYLTNFITWLLNEAKRFQDSQN